MTVRVVIVHPSDLTSPRPGGIQSFVRGFVRYAPDDFELLHVGVTGDAGETLGRWHERSIDGRTLRVLPLVHADETARRRVPLALRFGAALARRRPRLPERDAVLQFHRPGVALPLLGSRLPKVQVLHLTSADLTSRHSESRWRRLGPVLSLVERRTLPRMDGIAVVNDVAADAYRARFPTLADRISFLSNWYDEGIFHAMEDTAVADARRKLAAELGVPEGDRILLFAGRLDEQKQPGRLLDVMEILAAEPVRLVVVGDGALAAQLRTRVAGMPEELRGRVHLLGYRSRTELAEMMHGADMLLVTSAHETGPTVALEALACGLPVVGTPVGRLPSVLEDPSAGRVAASMAGAALADAVRATLDVPREAARRAAQAAGAPYRAAAVLGPFYDLHRRLAGAGPASDPPSDRS